MCGSACAPFSLLQYLIIIIIASAGPVMANVCGSLVLLFIALNPLVLNNNNYTID